MRSRALLITLCLTLTPMTLQNLSAQTTPGLPSAPEVEALWNGFWEAIMFGDLRGARRYIHSRRQHLFPGKVELKELQEMAYQMTFCRPDSTPFGLSEKELAQLPPSSLAKVEEVIYLVRCKRGEETAATQIGVRRDVDGVWRLSVF